MSDEIVGWERDLYRQALQHIANETTPYVDASGKTKQKHPKTEDIHLIATSALKAAALAKDGA